MEREEKFPSELLKEVRRFNMDEELADKEEKQQLDKLKEYIVEDDIVNFREKLAKIQENTFIEEHKRKFVEQFMNATPDCTVHFIKGEEK